MIPEVPGSLLSRLETQYGNDLAGEIVAGFQSRRPVTLRVNTLRSDIGKVTAALQRAGISWRTVSWYEDALILENASEDDLRRLPLYEDGSIYLQSLSAMVPALILRPTAGETILDMAAAPGGKTTQMAALSGGGALITACEKNKIRAERLQFNIDRQGARKAAVMNQDARQLDDLFKFDRILLDAPCTGSGTVLLTEGEPQRRMDETWIRKTAATQSAMLEKAMKLLRAGNDMVYSTCSILDIENEQIVEKAIRRLGAELVPIDPFWQDVLPCLPVRLPGTLCIRPTAEYEGFFVARLRKKK